MGDDISSRLRDLRESLAPLSLEDSVWLMDLLERARREAEQAHAHLVFRNLQIATVEKAAFHCIGSGSQCRVCGESSAYPPSSVDHDPDCWIANAMRWKTRPYPEEWTVPSRREKGDDDD